MVPIPALTKFSAAGQPKPPTPTIKNLDDKVIGVHEGIINFTIGQRKGIKVSDKEPLYVIKIN